MKNKLFYLFGIASLLCYTCVFYSCINGVDDEYLDQIYTGGNENDGSDGTELPDISGDYCENGDFALKMTYNGEELLGKKVIVMADENLESATITLAGMEKDLSTLTGLLEGLDSKFTTYSPVPGEKELVLTNVKMFRSGQDFIFEGEDIQPTRSVTFEGRIINEVMTINIKHMLANEKTDLLGKWKMGAAKQTFTMFVIQNTNNSNENPHVNSPLWLDWKSPATVDMGDVITGIDQYPIININRPMTGIFNLLMSNLVTTQLGGLIGMPDGIEKSIPKLIEYIAAAETGSMYASYSWNGAQDPQYVQNESGVIARYYYEDENKCRIELNADYLLSLIGGLINGTTRASTRAQPDNAKIIASELVGKLRPALEQGIPCDYTINGNNMTISIDGKYLLDVVRTISKLVNDEFVVDYIHSFIDEEPSIGDFAQPIKLLLKNIENALGEDCEYIKLGFNMVRMPS